MRKVFLSAVIVMAAFASCKKQEKPVTTTKTAHSVKREGVDDAANPANPYDDAGYNHNMVLQATRYIWSVPGANKADAYQAAADYIKANYGLSTPSNDAVDAEIASTLADEPMLYSAINNTSLTQTGKDFLTRLIALENSITSNPDGSYADFKAAVIALEAEVMSTPGLPEADRQRVLTTASIMRYSTLYWNNEAGGANTNDSNPCECRIWNWIKDHVGPIVRTAVSDAGGAIKGDWIGAALDSLGTGLGEDWN